MAHGAHVGNCARGSRQAATHEQGDAEGAHPGAAHGRSFGGVHQNLWFSIEDLYCSLGCVLPLGGPGDFKLLFKAVAAVKETQSKLFFSIGLHHLRRILELVGLTVCQERDVLVCILGQVVCLRELGGKWRWHICKSVISCGIMTPHSTRYTFARLQCMSTGETRIQHERGCTLAWGCHLLPHGTLLCVSGVTRSGMGFESASNAPSGQIRVLGVVSARTSLPSVAGGARC
jgi:hypothetical protein